MPIEKWKPEGYDWGSAAKLFWTPEEPQGKGSGESVESLGLYSPRGRYIWIDPKVSSQTEGVHSRFSPGETVESSRAGTLSHEISHWRLKHRGSERDLPLTLQDIGSKLGKQSQERWIKIRDEVQEMEVRLNQEFQDYYQDRGDSFLDYFKDSLIAAAVDSPDNAYIIKEIGYQALVNMAKRGIVPKRKKIEYLKEMNRFYNEVVHSKGEEVSPEDLYSRIRHDKSLR